MSACLNYLSLWKAAAIMLVIFGYSMASLLRRLGIMKMLTTTSLTLRICGQIRIKFDMR